MRGTHSFLAAAALIATGDAQCADYPDWVDTLVIGQGCDQITGMGYEAYCDQMADAAGVSGADACPVSCGTGCLIVDYCHYAEAECIAAGFSWVEWSWGGMHCTCQGCEKGYGDEAVQYQGDCEISAAAGSVLERVET